MIQGLVGGSSGLGILRHGGPLLVELLGGCPTPTTRQASGGDRHLNFYETRDNLVIVDLPDSRAAAATSLAVSSTGAFEHLETHELIEAEDLNPILEQAKGITSQLPGT